MKRFSHLNIGIIHDSAFQFYYQENIDVLRNAGVNIIEFSALKDNIPASLDALYIGGGFPETHAFALSENEKLRRSIKEAAEGGLPIYAECGGLMYLAQDLVWNEKTYPMVGILPFTIGVSKKPKGHGYTIARVETQNPFFPVGQVLRGHEFHYSYITNASQKDDGYLAFRMLRGEGIMNKMDGFCYKNVLATYIHLHALGTHEWAQGVIRRATAFNDKNLLIN
jgi:cobyrinic acid a,c-diamide synthase